MSEKFVASNGVEISRCGRGVYDHKGRRNLSMSDSEVDALREFFLHERDTELGRWRDPDSPYIVVYAPNEEGKVRVVDEHAGWGWEVSPESKAYSTSTLFNVVKAGHHYFEAHPEPKPWQDAKPGEVWVITTSNVGDEVAVLVTGAGRFRYSDGVLMSLTSEQITDARRVFPEVVSDDS